VVLVCGVTVYRTGTTSAVNVRLLKFPSWLWVFLLSPLYLEKVEQFRISGILTSSGYLWGSIS